jgi:uncharacterized protein (UPF0332 family)
MVGSKEDYINYRIQKSNETYEDAIILADKKRWNSCVNRLYYSSFYLTSALLFKNEIKADTHNGVKTQFFLHYIKTELLPKETGKLYSHLFDWRQETDYADFIEFNEELVKPMLESVKELNETLKRLLK